MNKSKIIQKLRKCHKAKALMSHNLKSKASHKLFHNLKFKTSHKLFHNLKSQGISINVIIIAAIALIVLVVLIAVFTGRFGLFSKGLKGCPGECYPTPCTGASIPGTNCKEEGKGDYCCIPLGSNEAVNNPSGIRSGESGKPNQEFVWDI